MKQNDKHTNRNWERRKIRLQKYIFYVVKIFRYFLVNKWMVWMVEILWTIIERWSSFYMLTSGGLYETALVSKYDDDHCLSIILFFYCVEERVPRLDFIPNPFSKHFSFFPLKIHSFFTLQFKYCSRTVLVLVLLFNSYLLLFSICNVSLSLSFQRKCLCVRTSKNR